MIAPLREDVARLVGNAHLKGRHGVLVERHAVGADPLGRRDKPKAPSRHGYADVYGPPAVAGRVVRAPQSIHVERAVEVGSLVDIRAVRHTTAAADARRCTLVRAGRSTRTNPLPTGTCCRRRQNTRAGCDRCVDIHDDPRSVAAVPRQPGPADLPQRYLRFRRRAQRKCDQCDSVHRCAYHHALLLNGTQYNKQRCT